MLLAVPRSRLKTREVVSSKLLNSLHLDLTSVDAADTLKKKLSTPLCRIVFNKFYPFILFQLWHIMTIALDKSYKSTFYLQLHNEMSA